MRLKSFDNSLIAITGLLGLLSLYQLYGAKYFTSTSNNEFRVASIVEQIKTVKRKRDFYQSWTDVNSGDGLSQNDEIYTHEQSSAKINFDNGTQISLFENSLLRIKNLNKQNTLSLDRGNLTAKLSKAAPKLDVQINGKKYSFESENANIQIEKGTTENKFLLLDGKAKLNIDAKAQEIKPNQVIIQDIKSGKLNIRELPFSLKLPLHNSIKYFSKPIEVDFSWTYTSKAVPSKILIAHDSSFKDIVLEKSVNDTHTLFTLEKEGIYYWKLISEDGIVGPIRSFTLKEEHPLLVQTNKNIIYKGPKLNELINISWSQDTAKKYLIKIESPDKKISEVEVTSNNYELTANQIGTYKVSVKVQSSNRPDAIWSEPASLEVIEAKAIVINSAMPELLEKVSYNQDSLPHLLSWSGPQSGVNYTIKLKNEKTVQEYQSENPQMLVHLNDAGTYTWEILGETPSGIRTNSITGKIILKRPIHLNQTPAEGAIIELEKPDQLVSFKWNQIENAKDYQFEVARDQSFSKIIYDKNIETNNISTTLGQTGKYFWRVRIKKGNAVEYSNPVSVEIKPTPPLLRPEINPEIKIKLKYLEEKSSSFNWIDLIIDSANADEKIAVAEWDLPTNPKVKLYIVEIYQDQNLTKLITQITSASPHIVWKNASAGKFFWRVSQVDFWDRKTEFSKVSTLNTEQVELPAPPPEIEKVPEVLIPIPEVKPKKKIVQAPHPKKIEAPAVEVKKEEVVIPKKALIPAPVITEKKVSHFLRVGFFPHQLTYQNKANQYSAKVSGTAINSWYGMYQRPVDMSFFKLFNSSLWISRGKVFKTITFTDLELNLKLHKVQNSFSWGPVIAVLKRTLYVESNLAITNENLTVPVAGLFIQKSIDRFTLNSEIKAGSLVDYHADVQYEFKKNIAAGVFFDSTSITKDANKHSFSRMGLNFNYTFSLESSLEDKR